MKLLLDQGADIEQGLLGPSRIALNNGIDNRAVFLDHFLAMADAKRPFQVTHPVNFRLGDSHQLPDTGQSGDIKQALVQRFVKLKISTRAMRTLSKKGLEPFAAEAGIDLAKH